MSNTEKLKFLESAKYKIPPNYKMPARRPVLAAENVFKLSCTQMLNGPVFIQFINPNVIDYAGATYGPNNTTGSIKLFFDSIQTDGPALAELCIFELNIFTNSSGRFRIIGGPPVFTIYNPGMQETQSVTAIRAPIPGSDNFSVTFITFVTNNNSIQISCSDLSGWPYWVFQNAQVTRAPRTF